MDSDMYRQFRLLPIIYRGFIQRDFKCKLGEVPQYQFLSSCHVFVPCFTTNLSMFRAFHLEQVSISDSQETEFHELQSDSEEQSIHIDKMALRIQSLLKHFSDNTNNELVQALDKCELTLSESLVLEVIRRHHSDWKSAFQFFRWVCNNPIGYFPGSKAYNEMLGILGKAKRFKELELLFDEMSKRGVLNERSYGIVVHRYAAAHKIDDAINFFYKRRQYGLELDLIAFQTLLLSLCRYKHVEAAEFEFHSKKSVFQYDTKTWNIILNGWCVRGNLRETKRFWNDIIRSKCKPNRVTYGIFINALCKSGKISTAVKLFQAMWEQGCTPDVVICNSVIDGLCFKKRIGEALEILQEMNERDCQPDVVTYNCLIKHLCKIQRMKMVFQLLEEMERKGGQCSPNSRTYSHLLSSAKTLEEVQSLLERMKSNGCKMTGDLYNLLLKLYMNWNCEQLVQSTWAEMLRDGLGPDQRCYTIMIHGRYDQGRLQDALDYFSEMTSKGMVPEPKTNLLVDAMKIKTKEKTAEETTDLKECRHERRRENRRRQR
ncbi:putative pentatricopeptide repeat-containing protein At3g15200 isoform X2 [Amaranthus tricolor]|uniref:putative pentatricopeptide repeat-containing protein At3g15200 isoform X2 n=1 Tax=Amaranthus tricolor TaxID=29722 RepID=UPI00258BDBAF|nr:putative pentatricopeptide repeat-containing protein At3g15200 isoform X2 [Amaranthus tricolor]XP_057533437.1 putative pentatricopeptide repeat-containing protein At3g15200 isoform X2 [Amaranthus tricolor]